MINQEQQIEQLLRNAPRPAPPADLKGKLIEQIELPPPVRQNSSGRSVSVLARRPNWLRRWWPALAPAAISAACAVMVVLQQSEIESVKKNVDGLSQGPGAAPTVAEGTGASLKSGATQTATGQEEEIERLTQLVKKLRAEVSDLEQLRAENDKLRAQLAAPSGHLTSEETAALEQASEKDKSMTCIGNLKQLSLAVRVWAFSNGDKFPTDLLQMTNEMATPKILHCPADTSRAEAVNFATYTAANCSYEYFAAGATELDPTRVLSRCLIHGHIGLCDGSVRNGVMKTHPDWLIQRDGKLYLQNQVRQQPDQQTIEQEFRRRYGLTPPGTNQLPQQLDQQTEDKFRQRYGLPPANTNPNQNTRP